MGNLLISGDTVNKWQNENQRAEDLLKLAAVNPNEERMINGVAREQKIKVWAMVGLGFSYALSLKRYFPDAIFTREAPMYLLTTLSIMVPCYGLAKVYTNREVIAKLELLEENHRLLKNK